MFQRIRTRTWIFLSFILVSWIGSIVATGAGVNLFPVDWNFANSGTFGDSFGPISAVMASLAAAAAFETLHDTREDARKSEIRERRREREEDLRTFENTFFNLLRSFESLVEQTDIDRGTGTNIKRGRDCYAYIYRVILTRSKGTGVTFEESFEFFFKKYINDLAHYFRYIYNMISFVDGSKSRNKYFYVKLIRATLSESELALIALNGMFHPEGKMHLRRIIEKYALLNNLSEEAISQLGLRDHFAPSAFTRAEGSAPPPAGSQ